MRGRAVKRTITSCALIPKECSEAGALLDARSRDEFCLVIGFLVLDELSPFPAKQAFDDRVLK